MMTKKLLTTVGAHLCAPRPHLHLHCYYVKTSCCDSCASGVETTSAYGTAEGDAGGSRAEMPGISIRYVVRTDE
jgi:hypothetical protein